MPSKGAASNLNSVQAHLNAVQTRHTSIVFANGRGCRPRLRTIRKESAKLEIVSEPVLRALCLQVPPPPLLLSILAKLAMKNLMLSKGAASKPESCPNSSCEHCVCKVWGKGGDCTLPNPPLLQSLQQSARKSLMPSKGVASKPESCPNLSCERSRSRSLRQKVGVSRFRIWGLQASGCGCKPGNSEGSSGVRSSSGGSMSSLCSCSTAF